MDLVSIVLGLVIIIFSSILHEVAHGLIAYRLGDPTAKLLGRLTLNPVKHTDLYMTIVMPLLTLIVSQGRFIFGGAKPVPVDPYNLRDGRRDLALVSLAGPLTNVILAVLGAVIAHLVFPNLSFGELQQVNLLGTVLFGVIYWNLLLAIFNLVPIPPLDGSKVFSLILPEDMAAAYLALESVGMYILIALLVFPGFGLMSFVIGLINGALSLLGF